MIRIANLTDVHAISMLHKDELSKSFLGSIGVDFLCVLYRYLIINEVVFVCEENDHVKGFVAASKCSKRIMFSFLRSQRIIFFKIALLIIKKPSLVMKFLELIFFMFKTILKSKEKNQDDSSLIDAELLSICVDEKFKNQGIGNFLVKELDFYYKTNNILEYKVIVGCKLISANKFYAKNGFVLMKKIRIHGNEGSNLYVKKIDCDVKMYC